jgi:hypothetical protein
MMAFTFPLPIADFWNQLLVQQITFDTPEQMEASQTGQGQQLRADLAPMLWSGEVRLGAMTRFEASHPETMLDILRPAGRSFYAYDFRRPFPLLDPTGTVLGAATPTIASLPNTRELTIAGLPAGYMLSRGDYLAFDYGAPARRALHRIVTGAVASGGGVTPALEVTPMIRTGALVGAAITLVRPACKAVLVAGSVSKGSSSRTITRDMAFQFQQTLGVI